MQAFGDIAGEAQLGRWRRYPAVVRSAARGVSPGDFRGDRLALLDAGAVGVAALVVEHFGGKGGPVAGTPSCSPNCTGRSHSQAIRTPSWKASTRNASPFCRKRSPVLGMSSSSATIPRSRSMSTRKLWKRWLRSAKVISRESRLSCSRRRLAWISTGALSTFGVAAPLLRRTGWAPSMLSWGTNASTIALCLDTCAGRVQAWLSGRCRLLEAVPPRLSYRLGASWPRRMFSRLPVEAWLARMIRPLRRLACWQRSSSSPSSSPRASSSAPSARSRA